MCVLAGEDAEDRGWVYFTEARQFPVKDLLTIDALWTFYSDGKFGFSVQRKIWVGQKRQWTKFFKQIDWVQGENNAYRKWPEEFIWKKEAARGHMPSPTPFAARSFSRRSSSTPRSPRRSPRTRRRRCRTRWKARRRVSRARSRVSRVSRNPTG